MRRILTGPTIIFTFLSLILFSCQKDESASGGGQAKLKLFLTDAPGDFEAVYIDVQDVLINVTGDSTKGWKSLQGVNAGVYDLLKLVNDDDTLLANADIPSGRLHQIRLVLGTENYVKIEGTADLIKLETPSAQQSGLKLNVQMDVDEGMLYTILLDFDVAKSIVHAGNKKYILKPVIRTALNAAGGSIKGVVMPLDFQTAVYAVQGVDTVASTFTGANGGYMIKGLPVGAYDVYYNPASVDYHDSLRTNIPVQLGVVTNIDTTFLRHQ